MINIPPNATIKKLKIKGLYVMSIKISSYRWCSLMSENSNIPIRNYTSKPIHKITDFIKLFEEHLSNLNWEGELTEEHGKAILEMERRITTNELGKLIII